MRSATSRQVPKGTATAQPVFIPAPIGGLNTRDPPALVPITEMSECSNFFPTTAGLVTRKGQTAHATSAPALCESLMVYAVPAGTETLFAAMGTAFYNITTAGAVGAAVVSGLTNAVWQHINFTNSAGSSYLCCFNGADSPRYWDGATWTTITGVSTPAITGLTTTTIISAAIHQRRMWLVQVNSLKAWYLPIDSVGGAAQSLDLGGIADLGGYIMAIQSWTVDGGTGVDDYLVCITSRGQIVLFAGTDPSSASSWSLYGVWNVAPPVGRRCFCQYKGDLLVLTASGILSATKVFRGDSSQSGMLSDKISATYTSAYISASAANYAKWQIIYYAAADMLLWCIGHSAAFPLNTVTGAWGGSFGFIAECWTIFGGQPYYAKGNGNFSVNRFWTGAADEGTTIPAAYFLSGYSDFGSPGVIKKPALMRAAMTAGASSLTALQLEPDFIPRTTPAQQRIGVVSGISPWYSAPPTGVSFAIQYATESGNEVKYNGAYVALSYGGIVGSANG